MYDGIGLLVFIRAGLSRVIASLLGLQLISDVSTSVYSRGERNTLSSGSVDLKDGVASLSSVSIPVSSISVVSVPLDEGAMGEGSGTSLGLDATGEA